MRSRFSSWSASATVFGNGVRTMCGALFRSTREDVVSVCRHIGSIATYRIVSFCGEGLSFFVPEGILFGAQFGPQHANTTWVVLCQRTAFDMCSIVS